MSPFKNKPLKKGPLKNISPRAYFRNFTVGLKIKIWEYLAPKFPSGGGSMPLTPIQPHPFPPQKYIFFALPSI